MGQSARNRHGIAFGPVLVHICRLVSLISGFILTYWYFFTCLLPVGPAEENLEGNSPGLAAFKTRDIESTSAAPCWQLVDFLSIPAHGREKVQVHMSRREQADR